MVFDRGCDSHENALDPNAFSVNLRIPNHRRDELGESMVDANLLPVAQGRLPLKIEVNRALVNSIAKRPHIRRDTRPEFRKVIDELFLIGCIGREIRNEARELLKGTVSQRFSPNSFLYIEKCLPMGV